MASWGIVIITTVITREIHLFPISLHLFQFKKSLSSFFLRHLFRWRVATRPFYLDNLQAREVSSLATLWMNQWTNFYGAAYSFFRRVFPMVSDVPTESSTYVWAFAGLCWSCLGESSFLPFIFVTSVICIASGPELNKQLKLTFSSSMNVLLVHIHIHPHDLVQPFACRLASPSVPFLLCYQNYSPYRCFRNIQIKNRRVIINKTSKISWFFFILGSSMFQFTRQRNNSITIADNYYHRNCIARLHCPNL